MSAKGNEFFTFAQQVVYGKGRFYKSSIQLAVSFSV